MKVAMSLKLAQPPLPLFFQHYLSLHPRWCLRDHNGFLWPHICFTFPYPTHQPSKSYTMTSAPGIVSSKTLVFPHFLWPNWAETLQVSIWGPDFLTWPLLTPQRDAKLEADILITFPWQFSIHLELWVLSLWNPTHWTCVIGTLPKVKAYLFPGVFPGLWPGLLASFPTTPHAQAPWWALTACLCPLPRAYVHFP